MIRCQSNYLIRKDDPFPDRTSTSSSFAARGVSNRHGHQTMHYHPCHLHFSIGRRPTAVQNKNDTTRLGLRSFYEKRDEVGPLTNKLSNTRFQDLKCESVRNISSTVKKEQGEDSYFSFFAESRNEVKNFPSRIKEEEEGHRNAICGETQKNVQNSSAIVEADREEGPNYSQNSLSKDNMNGSGFTIGFDRDDQMIFPWQELEKDLPIFLDKQPNIDASSPTLKLHDLGLASVLSTPSPAGLSVSTTIPLLASPEKQTLVELNDTKASITHRSTPKDSTKSVHQKVSDDGVPEINYSIRTNEKAIVRFPTGIVEACDKRCFKSQDIGYRITRHKHWSKVEDDILRNAMSTEICSNIDWQEISNKYFLSTRSAVQCKHRWKNHVKPGIVRGRWCPFEDELILNMVSRGKMWKEISSHLPGRVGESIRDRYVNHLDPSLKKSAWTKEEDEILFENQRKVGNKWSEIRKLLPGRSDNAIKNRFHNKKNSFLRWLKKDKKKKELTNSMKANTDIQGEAGINALPLTVYPDTVYSTAKPGAGVDNVNKTSLPDTVDSTVRPDGANAANVNLTARPVSLELENFQDAVFEV